MTNKGEIFQPPACVPSLPLSRVLFIDMWFRISALSFRLLAGETAAGELEQACRLPNLQFDPQGCDQSSTSGAPVASRPASRLLPFHGLRSPADTQRVGDQCLISRPPTHLSHSCVLLRSCGVTMEKGDTRERERVKSLDTGISRDRKPSPWKCLGSLAVRGMVRHVGPCIPDTA